MVNLTMDSAGMVTSVTISSTSTTSISAQTVTTQARTEESYDEIVNKRIKSVKDYSKTFSLKFDYKSQRGYNTLLKRLGEDRMKILREVKVILNEVYPNRFDFQFKLIVRTRKYVNTYGANTARSFVVPEGVEIDAVYIVIWFPEISVKNKHDESITIKDVYVRFPLTKDKYGARFVLGSLEGTRTTLSVAEYEARYLHSHLPQLSVNSFTGTSTVCEYQNFCLGESDLGIMTIGLVNHALSRNELDPELFKVFLLSIQTYLEWESVDTRPHIVMNNAIKRSYDYRDVSEENCHSVWIRILNQIKGEDVKLDLDWSFGDRFYIIDNDKLERLFKNSWVRDSFLLFRDATGRYFEENDDINPDVIMDRWLPFRGEKKFFRVEGEVKKAINRDRFIHPKIKEYVKQRLELYANSAKIREVAISRLSASDSAR